MTQVHQHITKQRIVRHLVVDMSDCYTWSFPEFIPFCLQLYYFSNFKDFNRMAQARL